MADGDYQEVHRMARQETEHSGFQEWWCPTCGRRLLFSWPPNYRKIVIDPGNVWAQHAGGTGGVDPVGVSIPTQASQIWTDEDDRQLEAWQDAGEGDVSR
jgi:hypothetical protein